jgi:hypothetical protein
MRLVKVIWYIIVVHFFYASILDSCNAQQDVPSLRSGVCPENPHAVPEILLVEISEYLE